MLRPFPTLDGLWGYDPEKSYVDFNKILEDDEFFERLEYMSFCYGDKIPLKAFEEEHWTFHEICFLFWRNPPEATHLVALPEKHQIVDPQRVLDEKIMTPDELQDLYHPSPDPFRDGFYLVKNPENGRFIFPKKKVVC